MIVNEIEEVRAVIRAELVHGFFVVVAQTASAAFVLLATTVVSECERHHLVDFTVHLD